jgi:hypothetical protein
MAPAAAIDQFGRKNRLGKTSIISVSAMLEALRWAALSADVRAAGMVATCDLAGAKEALHSLAGFYAAQSLPLAALTALHSRIGRTSVEYLSWLALGH